MVLSKGLVKNEVGETIRVVEVRAAAIERGPGIQFLCILGEIEFLKFASKLDKTGVVGRV